ncbi:hypothetical protein BE20_43520 [Sorangium cellulosum]|nr:hypothetical protein BE20_43520 [Sorangium cellulosum]
MPKACTGAAAALSSGSAVVDGSRSARARSSAPRSSPSVSLASHRLLASARIGSGSSRRRSSSHATCSGSTRPMSASALASNA